MTYLGIDYGARRWGLACGESEIGVASPLPAANQQTEAARWQHVQQLCTQRGVGAFVVGWPLRANGTEGEMTAKVSVFIKALEARFNLPVHTIDERFTSSAAADGMEALGLQKKAKNIKGHQKNRASGQLDSRSAAILLQDFLDARTLNV